MEAIKYVKIALGIDDWIRITPAPKPDKLKNLIKVKPIIGPITTLPIDEIIEFFNEKTLSWVKDIPRDISIRTIIVYPSSITVFKTTTGILNSK